ncbi:MAG: hypothetical protein HOH14_02580 [Gammaproteobacteria bacterium]|jgi:hypothetical protein|nr:hypothetical protein [Gammaproteobacteria bacterium]
MNRLQQIFTICLITLSLLGVQVIQASPLHDHGDHVVDCALCHFDNTEDALLTTAQPQPRFDSNAIYSVADNNFIVLLPHHSFQSRAPPSC